MPSNDTENIYATEYGGQGAPIPATKISYDGTGTSISATNVQGAITELDGDVQSAQSDINALKTKLTNNMVFEKIQTVEVLGDGVKTFNALLVELSEAINTYFTTLADDETVSLRWFGGAYSAIPLAPVMYTKNNTFNSASFIGITYTDTWQTQVLHSIRISATSADCHWLMSQLGSAAQTFSTDVLSNVLANELKLSVTFEVYKKV